jgi:1,4-alpha-glucan branching enzyme
MSTPKSGAGRPAPSRITADDLHLFNEGTHYRLHEKLGAHVLPGGGVSFAVWAPNARYVSVVGDFNGWDRGRHPMAPVGGSGIWATEIREVREGAVYKYHVASRDAGYAADKADPFGFMHEMPPRTGSVVRTLGYTWNDAAWMKGRGALQRLDRPMSVYEMHMGSWQRAPEDPSRWLTYREIAPALAGYMEKMGFTHVELMPVMEHPFYASWGYQTTGYFAPTCRYGTPQDFMHFVDTLHQRGIGVILDWVPSHFPTDEHGLGYFDGTHLFEHADRRQGFHPDWKSAIFNYSRHEVRAFLISSAAFWLEKYHADGLRVDAVASMLYLDYGRNEGEWIPNEFGGRENLGAIEFMRQLNTEVYRSFPDVQTIAEESTAWPMVSRPTYVGGLGFGMKWDMGWMHDTLKYFGTDPVYRRYEHTKLNFRGLYMYSENYMLPLSHDEVVHMKGSLIGRMPGDEWQRFANLRLVLADQWTHPGKKLLFMGGEFGQWAEWNHEVSLDWHLAEGGLHKGVQRLVEDLNKLYRSTPSLHEGDCEASGFEWVEANDNEHSVVAYLRKGKRVGDAALVVLNCTPVPRHNYVLGVPHGDVWREVLNTDATEYGGSGMGNMGVVRAGGGPHRQFSRSLSLTLPPLSALVLVPDAPPEKEASPARRKKAGRADG